MPQAKLCSIHVHRNLVKKQRFGVLSMYALVGMTTVIGSGLITLLMPFASTHATGIQRLAPAQSFSVDIPPAPKAVPLPPVPGFFDDLIEESTVDSTDEYDSTELHTSLLNAGETLRSFSINHKQMGTVSLSGASSVPRANQSIENWELGSAAWRYQGMHNTDVLIGNAEMGTPNWISSPQLGGVQISQRFSENDERFPWRYNLSVGALDYSNSKAEGDLQYGPTATGLWVDADVSSQVQVEALYETAPAMQLGGVGARYQTEEWGAWSSSIARASHSFGSGWRYQTRYDADISSTLNVGLASERYQGDFADLSSYGKSALGSGVKHAVDANLGMGRWGSLQGQLVTQRSQFGTPSQQLGVTQQFWYSPNLRIGLQAQRELLNGDYNMVLRFAVPLP